MARRNGDETKLKLADAFRQCMATKPIDKISVKGLVELCDINRQTFYYHFHDLYDLAKWMYLRDLKEALAKCSKCTTWEEGLRTLISHLDKDSQYHLSIYSSGSYHQHLRREFLDSLTESLEPTFKPMFDKLGYDSDYRAFLIRMYGLVLYEFIERRARGVSFSTLDGFIANWLRSINEQYRGALIS